MIFYRHWRPVQAVSFDLDDTLYDNQPVIDRAEQLTLSRLHAEFSATRGSDIAYWRRIRAQLLKQEPQLMSDMTALRRRGLDIGLSDLGLSGSEKQRAIDLGFDCFYFYRSDFSVAPPLVETLMQLSRQVPLVAITNGNVNPEQIGLQGVFRFSLHASLNQPMKPHTCMFNKAAEQLGVPAADILHVGDNLQKDVMGALRAGYQAAWYAIDRPMNLNSEPVSVLPHVQLDNLSELLILCP